MVVFVYVCLLFASSLYVLFAVTVITTSYFSVGFLLPPVFCVCFSLFFMLQRKKEMKKRVRSTRRGSLWKFNVNTAPITCDQWFVYPELLFPPMKDSCDSLTGFGSLLLIFLGWYDDRRCSEWPHIWFLLWRGKTKSSYPTISRSLVK